MKAEGLNELRARIDSIDDQIAGLVLKRIELSNFIMQSKAPAHAVDTRREDEIIERYSEKLLGVSTPMKSKRLVLALIAASSFYPEENP